MKRLSTVQELQGLLDGVDTILLDCDGVIWNGNVLYPGVREALYLFHEREIRHFFLTNNATASRAHYCEKFHALGLKYVTKDQIYTSGSASAHYLKTTLIPTLPENCRDIYLIGQAGLEDELRDVGLSWTGGTEAEDNVFMPNQDFTSIKPNSRIGIVLQGFDMHINYKKYCKAYTYLSQNPTCKLVLTNADRDVFTADVQCPGEGALAAPLLGISKDTIIVGKPERKMLDVLIDDFKLDRSRTIMIGDRLETDMLMAIRGQIQSLLVLTGSSTEADLVSLKPKDQPTFVLAGLGSFSQLGQGNGTPFDVPYNATKHLRERKPA